MGLVRTVSPRLTAWILIRAVVLVFLLVMSRGLALGIFALVGILVRLIGVAARSRIVVVIAETLMGRMGIFGVLLGAISCDP